jgi:hypothetical protein
VDADEGKDGPPAKKERKKGKSERTAKSQPLNIGAALVKDEELRSERATLDRATQHDQFKERMAARDLEAKARQTALEIQLEESRAKRVLIELEMKREENRQKEGERDTSG